MVEKKKYYPDPKGDENRFLCFACCCWYDACDFNDMFCGIKGASDCLCLRSSYCIACNTPNMGCGCTGRKEYEVCKLGCVCCECAMVKPTTCCGMATQVFCWYTVASLPCSDEYVPDCICTICLPGCQVAPTGACCDPPPPLH
eukprot:Nitzschia sp. Nitz4//scaffold225_size51843//22637//23273//NITZ4_006896-RA/size51843-snap-gene-0.9-mRNA-1//-1//CDS//3329542678//872//frame0